jgi:hypothetical protein
LFKASKGGRNIQILRVFGRSYQDRRDAGFRGVPDTSAASRLRAHRTFRTARLRASGPSAGGRFALRAGRRFRR